MATSATVQSYMAIFRPQVGAKNHLATLSSLHLLPCQRVAGATLVRCQAEPEKPAVETETPTPQTVLKTATPTATSPTPKPTAKVSTKFSDVLAFSGPAPERINGRLAMIGFVSALAVEAARGQDLVEQLMNGGLPWFLGTAVLFSVASLVPLFKGVTVQSRSGDLMSSDAELWNGRLAMLGLVALAFTEYLKGGPLV
ncbi:early light-induced protein 1, chloroplastic-like [Dioscorea cayenensis subsp. rotundata]|uniref:Early light-induced protein 1, chloroplastic-like n=1 Tax=Dioscorea cayennensis subsp. rotundata TaxID=55577 RepID=A0AB40CM11_DIOCR|nr:early light-induced protein 1, chloroplastic-like [Dioscorea cayenensis subsp. rotundata]